MSWVLCVIILIPGEILVTLAKMQFPVVRGSFTTIRRRTQRELGFSPLSKTIRKFRLKVKWNIKGGYHLSEYTGWDEPLDNGKGKGKGFSKISKPNERDGAYHLQFNFPQLFSAAERLETRKLSK